MQLLHWLKNFIRRALELPTQYAKDWYYKQFYSKVGNLGALDYIAVNGSFINLGVAGSVYATDNGIRKLLGHVPKKGGFVRLGEHKSLLFVCDRPRKIDSIKKGKSKWSPTG